LADTIVVRGQREEQAGGGEERPEAAGGTAPPGVGAAGDVGDHEGGAGGRAQVRVAQDVAAADGHRREGGGQDTGGGEQRWAPRMFAPTFHGVARTDSKPW